jgi:hypothetical protein
MGIVRTVAHAIDIPASPATVWRLLAQTDRYPEWNPFMTALTGQLAVGERLAVTIRPGRRVIDDTEAGFAAMNVALRDRAVAHADGPARP